MSAAPSLRAIASALGGRVIHGRHPHVAAPYPGKKRSDRSLHVFVNDNGDIGIHVFRDGVDPIEVKDQVRRACGMDAWQPKRRETKAKAEKAVPFTVRNYFFGETLAVCRHRKSITAEQFALLVNDLRLRGDTRDAVKYQREFKQDTAALERCMATTPRHFKADERAKILNLTYAERQHLQLRRTGSVDVDKVGRERARRDRFNEKRRAARAAARLSGVNKQSQVSGKITTERKEISNSDNTARTTEIGDSRQESTSQSIGRAPSTPNRTPKKPATSARRAIHVVGDRHKPRNQTARTVTRRLREGGLMPNRKNIRGCLEMMDGILVQTNHVKTQEQANSALSVIRMQLKDALDGLSPIFGKDVLLAVVMEIMDEDDDDSAPQTKSYFDHGNEQFDAMRKEA